MELNLADPCATGSTESASEARDREIHDFVIWAEAEVAHDDDVPTRHQASCSTQRGGKCNGGAGAAGKPPGDPRTRSRGPALGTITALLDADHDDDDAPRTPPAARCDSESSTEARRQRAKEQARERDRRRRAKAKAAHWAGQQKSWPRSSTAA